MQILSYISKPQTAGAVLLSDEENATATTRPPTSLALTIKAINHTMNVNATNSHPNGKEDEQTNGKGTSGKIHVKQSNQTDENIDLPAKRLKIASNNQ